jgi:protein-S-isoprenylcysteine O-methyltransferase Ste14
MRETVPAWAAFLSEVQRRLVWDFPGPRRIRIAWAVNVHKYITILVVYGMMRFYDRFDAAAWVYLALHGIYGYCWLLKDFGFRDDRLETPVSVGGGVMLYAIIGVPYWIIPWVFMSQPATTTGFDLFFAVALHTLGVVMMTASDCQRHFTLKFRKGLITGGMFRYTRNPNYLGEIMLYSAYAFLAAHWLAWAVVAYATVCVFLPNMYQKDASISRHPGWAEYKASSGLLIPWAWFSGRAVRDIFGHTPAVS